MVKLGITDLFACSAKKCMEEFVSNLQKYKTEKESRMLIKSRWLFFNMYKYNCRLCDKRH